MNELHMFALNILRMKDIETDEEQRERANTPQAHSQLPVLHISCLVVVSHGHPPNAQEVSLAQLHCPTSLLLSPQVYSALSQHHHPFHLSHSFANTVTYNMELSKP
jgi:hypothetical protein